MKKIYATYRKKPLNQWAWLYTPSYFFDEMFWDYKAAGLTWIDDFSVSDERYIWELVPWVPKLTRLLVGYYNDNYVKESDFRSSLLTTGSEFHISLFDTSEEAKQRVRDNTDLVEEWEWKFILSEVSELNPETTYLIIN